MIRRFSQLLRPSAATPYVKLSEPGLAGVITLDRLDVKNAFNHEMVIACHDAIKEFEGSKKVVIIKSSSSDIFSSGGDVKVISSSSTEEVKNVFRKFYRTQNLISTYNVPYVALISGVTFGGASALTMSAKYRVATEKTVFAMPETVIGFYNNSGGYFLPRLVNNLGIYMGLTGARITGYDVKKAGIATHFVESANLPHLEQNLIKCETHEDVENVLDELPFTPESTTTKLDEDLERIKRCFRGLTVEQILESLRSDGSEWAQETLKTLHQVSPTSVKVCHRQLNLGRHMSVKDCLRMEWRLAVHFAIQSDFKEGCRAHMHKDVKPKWNPATIEEVNDGHVSRFFGPLPDGDELTFE